MLLYLSGPMSLYKATDLNYGEFNRVAAKLREAGHDVLNPAELGQGVPGWGWRDKLIRDNIVILVSRPQAVVLLPDWEKSEGSLTELFIAIKIVGAKPYEYVEDTVTGKWHLREILIDWTYDLLRGVSNE